MDTQDQLPDSEWKRRFRRQLKRWYGRHARDLPWRKTRDPYPIWVSEIMLQQTQVVTVIPYFDRFLSRFPTVVHLARAQERHVLRMWEGLGYYRRARQLHRAAKQIMERHNGSFPTRREHVCELPGVGRYTAGAILSIAFDQREPILESNTIRLFSRLLAFGGNPTSKSGQVQLWSFAEAILPRKDIGRFNQALMELGSTVCTPKSPRCESCPAAAICPTRSAGLQESIPMQKRKTVPVEVAETAVVVLKGNQVLLRRCLDGERWAGLWDFPRFKSGKRHPRDEFEIDRIKQLTGVDVEIIGDLMKLKHGVTKYRISLACRAAKYTQGRLRRGAEMMWVSTRKLSHYPLSTTGRRIAELVHHASAKHNSAPSRPRVLPS